MDLEKLDGKNFDRQNRKFVKEFLTKYMSLGFGNLPKKEIDILVFDLLLRYGYLDGKDNYEIANELCIDDKRLRRLQIDAAVRNNIGRKKIDSHADDVKFVKDLLFGSEGNDPKEKIEFNDDNSKVEFSIDDPVIKRGFLYAVRRCGYSYDEYLNPDKVVLPLYVFLAVFMENDKSIYENVKGKYKDFIKDKKNEQKAIPIDILNIAKKFIIASIPALDAGISVGTWLKKDILKV